MDTKPLFAYDQQTCRSSEDMTYAHKRLSKCEPAESAIFGPRREKTCLRRFANNTGADQPAHPRRLISAIVFLFFESIICKLGTGEISIF